MCIRDRSNKLLTSADLHLLNVFNSNFNTNSTSSFLYGGCSGLKNFNFVEDSLMWNIKRQQFYLYGNLSHAVANIQSGGGVKQSSIPETLNFNYMIQAWTHDFCFNVQDVYLQPLMNKKNLSQPSPYLNFEHVYDLHCSSLFNSFALDLIESCFITTILRNNKVLCFSNI